MRRKLMTLEQVPTLPWAANLKQEGHFKHQLPHLADMPLKRKCSHDTGRLNTEAKWEALSQELLAQVTLLQQRMEAVWGIKLLNLGIQDPELLQQEASVESLREWAR